MTTTQTSIQSIDYFALAAEIVQDHYYDTLIVQRGYPEAYRLVVDEVKKLRLQLCRRTP